MLLAQEKLAEALKVYRDMLAIDERLAAADHNNTEWQHDLAVAYNRVGDVLKAEGKLEEALKPYHDSLTIAERLTAADHNNTEWQHDLAVAYNRVGDVLKAEGKLEEALKPYHDSLAITERLTAADHSNTKWQRDLWSSIGNIGDLAFELLKARDFTRALKASDLVISIASDEIWLYTNRAHALMFLARLDEARAVYLRYRGEKNVNEGKPWETTILSDFAELRKAGLTHPLMDEIEKVFAEPAQEEVRN